MVRFICLSPKACNESGHPDLLCTGLSHMHYHRTKLYSRYNATSMLSRHEVGALCMWVDNRGVPKAL